jgi:DNA-binding MarR family transcriptional regulator
LTGRLEEMGLVDRTQDDADARCSQVGLTPKGEALLVQASRRADEYLASQISALHPGDQHRLLEALPALIHLLETKA